MASPPAGNAAASEGVLDAFVSYAREDSEFVHRLVDRADAAERSIYADFRDIPVWSPDWQADLDDAIDRSGAFLLVLTPNSLRSPNVAIELRRAIGQGKRLKPLLLADVDAGKIDSAIREPQWIDFRDAGAFDARFDDLLTFLDTDVEWVRKHTRFGGLANEWERRGEDRSLLLGRTDLRDAAAWLATQAGKQPPPTPLQVRFVAASAAGARRRKRLVRGAGAAVAVVAGVLGTFALLQTRQANSNARVARSRQIAAAASAQLANDPTASLRLAIRAVTTAPTSQAVAALRQGIAQSYERAVLRGLPTSVGGPTVDEALFSPDGALVAGLTLLAGVRVWDARTAKPLATLRTEYAISGMAFLPRGDRLVTVGHRFIVWDAMTGRRIGTSRPFTTDEHHVTLSPDASLAAIAGFGDTAELRSTRNGALVATLAGHTDTITSFAFSREGRLVATTSGDHTVRIWDTVSGAPVTRIELGDAGGNSAAFSPDDTRVVTSDSDGRVGVFAVPSGKRVRWLVSGRSSPATDAVFSPDGTLVAAGALDGTVHIWRADTGEAIATMRHSDTVWTVSFSPDSRLLVSAGSDSTARVWDSQTGLAVAALVGHDKAVRWATFGPDGRSILTTGADGTARIWRLGAGGTVVRSPLGPMRDVGIRSDGTLAASVENEQLLLWRPRDGSIVRQVGARARWITTVALSPDGQYVLTAASYGDNQIWDADTGRLVATLGTQQRSDSSAAFSPDGGLAVTVGDGTRVWSIPSGDLRMTVPGTSCRGGAISPDGRYLASPCTDLPGRIFQIDNGSVAAVLHGPAPSHATATLAAYSPQGDLVATTGTGGTIRFWASPSGRPGRVLSGQGSTVIGLAFSPDGRELGAASGAGAQLWRVTDGALIASLTDNGAGFESVAFSRDGRYFVTGGGDGAVRVWDASTGDPVETFRTHSLAVYRAVFSRQGNLIASASADRTARIDVCDLCESVPALVRLAKEHLPATG